jgi:hypothetical protein
MSAPSAAESAMTMMSGAETELSQKCTPTEFELATANHKSRTPATTIATVQALSL